MSPARYSTIVLSAAAIAAAAPAAASPWFGTWKLRLKAADEKPETLVYSDAGNGAMRMVSVEQNSIIVTRLDGEAAPDLGAARGQGNSLSVKATSPVSYSWTFTMAGKPFVQGFNTLAPDGRSFTEISWLIGKPEKRFTLVYDRQ